MKFKHVSLTFIGQIWVKVRNTEILTWSFVPTLYIPPEDGHLHQLVTGTSGVSGCICMIYFYSSIKCIALLTHPQPPTVMDLINMRAVRKNSTKVFCLRAFSCDCVCFAAASKYMEEQNNRFGSLFDKWIFNLGGDNLLLLGIWAHLRFCTHAE